MAGYTRFRNHQLGKQTAIGTAVAATRRVPWRGAITVNPNHTFADVDTGSRDPVISPYPTALDVSSTLTGPVTFNDLPYRWAAAVKSNVSPTGAVAKTWTFQTNSLVVEGPQWFTDEWSDDTGSLDGIQAFGGVIESFEESMPEDLGPWTLSDGWVYAGANLQSTPTSSLSVDASPTFVFGADTDLKIDSTAATIGQTAFTNALRTATFRITNNLDHKRYANGSNTRFQLADYGYGERVAELELQFDKTVAVMNEAAKLDDDPVVTRYIEVNTVSPTLATTGVPYQYRRRMAAKLMTRADGEIGGNATITLTYRVVYDATLGYAFEGLIVNTLSAL